MHHFNLPQTDHCCEQVPLKALTPEFKQAFAARIEEFLPWWGYQEDRAAERPPLD